MRVLSCLRTIPGICAIGGCCVGRVSECACPTLSKGANLPRHCRFRYTCNVCYCYSGHNISNGNCALSTGVSAKQRRREKGVVRVVPRWFGNFSFTSPSLAVSRLQNQRQSSVSTSRLNIMSFLFRPRTRALCHFVVACCGLYTPFDNSTRDGNPKKRVEIPGFWHEFCQPPRLLVCPCQCGLCLTSSGPACSTGMRQRGQLAVCFWAMPRDSPCLADFAQAGAKAAAEQTE